MYGISLSENDKKALQACDSDGSWTGENPLVDLRSLSATVKRLEAIGLVRGAFESGGCVVDYCLTDLGEKFILENPRLVSEPDSAQKWDAQEAHNRRTEEHYSQLEAQGRQLERHNRRSLCIGLISLLLSILSLSISFYISFCKDS